MFLTPNHVRYWLHRADLAVDELLAGDLATLPDDPPQASDEAAPEHGRAAPRVAIGIVGATITIAGMRSGAEARSTTGARGASALTTGARGGSALTAGARGGSAAALFGDPPTPLPPPATFAGARPSPASSPSAPTSPSSRGAAGAQKTRQPPRRAVIRRTRPRRPGAIPPPPAVCLSPLPAPPDCRGGGAPLR